MRNAPVRICAGAISDGRPYRDNGVTTAQSRLPVSANATYHSYAQTATVILAGYLDEHTEGCCRCGRRCVCRSRELFEPRAKASREHSRTLPSISRRYHGMFRLADCACSRRIVAAGADNSVAISLAAQLL